MGEAGRGHRAVWRWAAGVWAAAVVVGGGLTVWLQDSAEPGGPYTWQPAESGDPAPDPPDRGDRSDQGDRATRCPADGTAVLCAYATIP
ncbi:hypothetical protein [Streptomyces sp. NPDC052701]|uniref:hypothetical protein n=1 Tax=Streptomyces sp. NPDC052701 TaxID=3155533 RepID=UPI00341B7A07